MDIQGRKLAGAPRGFTLLEVIIVVLVIALFAGMIIPRMSGMGKRIEALTVDRVVDLLSAFGYRDSLASGRAAIEYSESNRQLLLLTLKQNARDDSSSEEIWSKDALAPAVKIPDSMTLRAYEDDKLLPETTWSILTNIDGTRPKIKFELIGEDTDTTLILDPWAQGPLLVDEMLMEVQTMPDAFDLDAAGQDRVPW